VHADLQALKAEWRAQAAQDISEHIARQFAEICELKREAWAREAYAEVRHLLKREADLLGLDAPHQVSGPQRGPIPLQHTVVEHKKEMTTAQEINEIDEHIRKLEKELAEIEAAEVEAEEEGHIGS
jgi:hypothetical protein